MTEIYKINEIFEKGKSKGSIYATDDGAEWESTPCLMMRISKQIEIYYGHIQLPYTKILTLTKDQAISLGKIVDFWKKRQLRYA